MDSKSIKKIKHQTDKQRKARPATSPQTRRKLENPLSESAFDKLSQHINSLDLDKLININYVDGDLCNMNSFRGRLKTKLDHVVVPTNDELSCEELKHIFKNIEEVPIILQKKKSKKIRDLGDGNLTSSSTILSTTSLDATASKSNEILMDYKGIQIKKAEYYLHTYNQSKRKINELFADEKSLQAQNSQLHSYYEQVKKLHKILDDFEKVIQKHDGINKEEPCAFTTEQEKIIECISNTIEQYVFIQENHHKLYISGSYDENYYSYEELGQLTDAVTELLQELN